VEGKEELQLQDLYDQVYNQASVWFHSLENRFRNQILQHFGPMPEKELDIQVAWRPEALGLDLVLLAELKVLNNANYPCTIPDPNFQIYSLIHSGVCDHIKKSFDTSM
ncbi:LON peptidase N-terminal domain and ring finger 1, like isoform X1, partial [Tachysurus ichikawai]